MSLDLMAIWHQRARPTPTDADFSVQLGCHLEEVVEMLDELSFADSGLIAPQARNLLNVLAAGLKGGSLSATVTNREKLLDSLADQVVTSVGVAHCAKMHIVEACRRVNTSNWSKFDKDGQPIFNASGKIAKGPDYKEPDLSGLF